MKKKFFLKKSQAKFSVKMFLKKKKSGKFKIKSITVGNFINVEMCLR